VKKVFILNMQVNVIAKKDVLNYIRISNKENNANYICVSNVHMCMATMDDVYYKNIVNSSFLTVPDGRPLVWAQRLLGYSEAEQIRGADLALAICEMSERECFSVGFLGGDNKTLAAFSDKIYSKFPNLKVDYIFAPPFRAISKEENLSYIEDINNSGIKILFVFLGCPKQEIWMAENMSNLKCTMVGLGAAIDFISENKKSPYRWIQKIGLEWLFRLISEPKRLFYRYIKHNPRFIYYFILQLLGRKYA